MVKIYVRAFRNCESVFLKWGVSVFIKVVKAVSGCEIESGYMRWVCRILRARLGYKYIVGYSGILLYQYVYSGLYCELSSY